ncbi:MAG: hypothetical protein QNJ91_03375 [Gammaproteobacteria bacterium]|nr:hypothetical protein [Gammaproteobacteria bacterium]
MQGSIAQTLSLAAHGNAHLSGKLDEDYFPHHQTFAFCGSVRFVELNEDGDSFTEEAFASDPVFWFGKMKDAGVRQYRIRYIASQDAGTSDRLSVAYPGGGGRWLIETMLPTGSDYWEGHWEAPEAADGKWRVTYARVLKDAEIPEPRMPPPEMVKTKLQGAFTNAGKFANAHGQEQFAEAFKRGVNALKDVRWERKIYPPEYAPLIYQQLLTAVIEGWVFGGEGSWNDLRFDDAETQQEYDRLSDQLFNFMNLALLVAANPWPRQA